MIGLLQRVRRAWVEVDGAPVARIGTGMVALIGIERFDTPVTAHRLLERMLDYRMFPDAERRMNLSLRDIKGELLLVPQFTLAADTRKGNRPGFSPAMPPDEARLLYAALLARAEQLHPRVQSGVFGADMQVSLTNDGPVTFWLRVEHP
ncbi:MAG TPA: D-aminoacyl-tRNA deacylase [Candidatus Acidoferrales bacterium]|nr:D-aminoacyl-tRNA deacylase [Candidatus Acidoferrales bacterium]